MNSLLTQIIPLPEGGALLGCDEVGNGFTIPSFSPPFEKSPGATVVFSHPRGNNSHQRQHRALNRIILIYASRNDYQQCGTGL